MFQFAVYPSAIYTILFTISFWAWFLFEMWVFWRDRRKLPNGPQGGARWLMIALILGISLAFNIPAFAPLLNIQPHFEIFFIVGLVLIWAGLLFRFWAVQTLGSLFSTKLVIQDQHELITTGPYQYVRNPSYSGALVTFAGIGLGIGNWLSLVVLLAMALILYVLRIKAEDKLLQDAFGPAYQEYKDRTWALIPYVW